LLAAVEDSVLLGPGSNRTFLAELLRDEAFIAGDIRTDTIDARMREADLRRPEPDARTWAAAAVLASQAPATRGRDVAWHSGADRGWPVVLAAGERTETVQLHVEAGEYRASVGETTVALHVLALEPPRARLCIDDVHETVWFALAGGTLAIDRGGLAVTFTEPRADAAPEDAGDGTMRAPMAGTVRRVDPAVGDRVEAGATLAIVEAMKMEHRVQTRVAGTVAEVRVKVGDQVTARQVMIVVTPNETKSEA
jgi:acetyl/propionyl-CoA carboxylase alpha subunit